MSNFIEIDDKELEQNIGLIVLQQLLNYCKEQGVDKIQYTKLRNRCDDQRRKITNGKHTFGGSFESWIKRFERNNLLSREKKGKRSIILPYIPHITDYLQNRKLDQQLRTKVMGPENDVDPKLLGKAVEEWIYEISSNETPNVGPIGYQEIMHNHFMRDAAIELDSYYISYFWKLSYSCPEYENLNLRLESIVNLLKTGMSIVESNDIKMPFEIILKYRRVRSNNEDLSAHLEYMERLSQKFMDWAIVFEKYKVSEEDKNNIANHRLNLLSEDTKSLYYKFRDTYLSYSLIPLYNKDMNL